MIYTCVMFFCGGGLLIFLALTSYSKCILTAGNIFINKQQALKLTSVTSSPPSHKKMSTLSHLQNTCVVKAPNLFSSLDLWRIYQTYTWTTHTLLLIVFKEHFWV